MAILQGTLELLFDESSSEPIGIHRISPDLHVGLQFEGHASFTQVSQRVPGGPTQEAEVQGMITGQSGKASEYITRGIRRTGNAVTSPLE
jgi:hypothetical protein